jgi:CBS domain-containing protein
MKVREVMTSHVKSCRPETNLAAVATLMWEGDCGVLPVVDNAGKVVGMITDRDIAIATATQGRLAAEIAVSDVISGKVYACTVDEDVKPAFKTMRHERVHRLPVVNEDGMLQGILCMNDMVLRAEEAKGRHVPDFSYEEVMSTLKAICEHRPARAAAHI